MKIISSILCAFLISNVVQCQFGFLDTDSNQDVMFKFETKPEVLLSLVALKIKQFEGKLSNLAIKYLNF